jgi:hypothetical protein
MAFGVKMVGGEANTDNQNLDNVLSQGGTVSASSSVSLTDNAANALEIKEGSNSFLKFVTTNSAETVDVGKTLNFPGATGTNKISIPDNLADALSIYEGSNLYARFITTNAGEELRFYRAGNEMLRLTSSTPATGIVAVYTPENIESAKKVLTKDLQISTTGNFDLLGGMVFSTSGGLTAAGTTISDALALANLRMIHIVTTVASGTGVKLTNASTGQILWVTNEGANALAIYPNTGSENIDALAAGAAYSLAAGASRQFIKISSTKWISR